MKSVAALNMKRIGQGRSAVVYLADNNADQLPLVNKVFTGDDASKLVLYLLTGSANPYTWCKAAVQSAIARRVILQHMTRYWFDGRLRLPRLEGWGWNEHHKAYEICMELIQGCHAPLLNPVAQSRNGFLDDLVDNIMKPLQRHLIDAGFDGLVWQAGKGNPVAASNFMLEKKSDDHSKWVWIDLESGVPALFAFNPAATMSFYLPKSLKHRRWLFDDVDLLHLRNYLSAHNDDLLQRIGHDALVELNEHVDILETAQKEWKSIKRYRRSIEYEYSQDKIGAQERSWYLQRPVRWYMRCSYILPLRLLHAVKKRLVIAYKWFCSLRPYHYLKRTAHYVVSSEFRWRLARYEVSKRIRSWRRRGFLEHSTSVDLLRELKRDVSCEYLTDFSIHLAVKPLVKLLQWWVFPLLWAAGAINELTLVFLLVVGGSAVRTFYTLGRFVQAAFKRQPLPWVALSVGIMPVIGNAAYPLQLLYRSAEDSSALARFIVYDLTTMIGRKIPIWGGPDTLFEHFFNRAGFHLTQVMTRLKLKRAGVYVGDPALSSSSEDV